MMDDRRKNPEDLLDVIERSSAAEQRGRLRLFLGMCPGVGKTYAMLRLAREQMQRGVRVAVGIVETHGRTETESLLKDLQIYPRKNLEYKGATLQELDLDSVLADRPTLVLVDELAHTNAPGSRHEKRWQDIEEILNAGINVYTTLNIQHIESRNDQVAQITGVHVRETVPDSFLDIVDQIELVDLSPEELLRRLREGKVYLGDRAESAIQNFFKEEHLTALRELALRFTAEKVDQDLHDQMTIKGIEGPWNTNERLLVGVSHSPYSARLIRVTRRKAHSLEAAWIALYVETGESLRSEDQRMLQENLALARRLGAEVLTVTASDVATAIQKVCLDRNVTQIVIGRPDRRFFKDFFARGTLLDQLVHRASKVDIHIIRAGRAPRFRGVNLQWPGLNTAWTIYYNTFWFLTAVSFFCYALLPYVGYRALGSVFLLSILVVATLTSRGPILFAAALSAVVWNFVFIPPQFTFAISSWDDFMMVLSFFVTASVGGLLTSRVRRQETILQKSEEQTRQLYELVQYLADAKTLEQIQDILISTVNQRFQGQSTVYFVEKDNKIDWARGYGAKLEAKDLAVVQWVFDNNKPAGWSTSTLSAAGCLCLPVKGNDGLVGVFAFFPASQAESLTVEKENFLETVLSQAAISFERFRFSEAAENARLYEASEALHQTLLNSVSHELRTPITAIIGSATALRDPMTLADEPARDALTAELTRSAHRLDRVVENLLDLSRLQKGTLQLKQEWFDAGELFSAVRTDLKEDFAVSRLKLICTEPLLLEADFHLLSHALAQVVFNAHKYAPPDTPIEVEMIKEAHWVRILVRDCGQGIPVGLEKQIFEKFFRLPGTPAGGLGLGLTIVLNIVELHGGKVSARNRTDHSGAIFEIILPWKNPPLQLREALL